VVTTFWAVFGLIFSSWLSTRTEGNRSPACSCPVTTALVTAKTTWSWTGRPGRSVMLNGSSNVCTSLPSTGAVSTLPLRSQCHFPPTIMNSPPRRKRSALTDFYELHGSSECYGWRLFVDAKRRWSHETNRHGAHRGAWFDVSRRRCERQRRLP